MKPLTKTVVNRGGGIAARFALAHEESLIDRLSRIETKPDASEGTLNVARTKAANAKKTVANAKPVANSVANVANKPRYAKWRDANPELYKKRQAALMRKRRAAGKAAKEKK